MARLLLPKDAVVHTLICLAEECGIAQLICLGRESTMVQSFPLVVCCASCGYDILYNWCFGVPK